MAGCHVKPEQAFNLIFGYNGIYVGRTAFVITAAGTKVLYGATVDPGEVWVVTSAAAFNATSNCSFISIGLYDGADTTNITQRVGPGINITVNYQGAIAMKQGYSIFAAFQGCLVNDLVVLDIIGYKMKLTQ